MASRISETFQSNVRTKMVEGKVIELASLTLGRDLDTSDVDELLYGTNNGFDSIALMEFILRLEEEFGINIPDQDLDPDVFSSISTIVAYMHRRLDGGA